MGNEIEGKMELSVVGEGNFGRKNARYSFSFLGFLLNMTDYLNSTFDLKKPRKLVMVKALKNGSFWFSRHN